jgi:hypothetical protein
MLKSTALLLSICFFSFSARAETWLCAYTNDDNQPAITKLVINGDKLVMDGKAAVYTVLVNNDVGLVATFGLSTIDPDTKQPIIFALMLLLERATGKFKRAGSANYHDVPSQYGNCVQN